MELVQQKVENPVQREQPAEQKIIRNSKEAGKSGQSKDTVKVPKMPGKEHQSALPTTSLSERKGNATPVRNLKQKADENEYVFQLIKKMGSEKELPMYEKVWAASNSTIQSNQGTMPTTIDPKPLDLGNPGTSMIIDDHANTETVSEECTDMQGVQ
ncbi:glycoside hydrolase family 28 [Sesbania bispinosa]|nr:glycoside hydrolase family 28 [Sesbania bispinosa]